MTATSPFQYAFRSSVKMLVVLALGVILGCETDGNSDPGPEGDIRVSPDHVSTSEGHTVKVHVSLNLSATQVPSVVHVEMRAERPWILSRLSIEDITGGPIEAVREIPDGSDFSFPAEASGFREYVLRYRCLEVGSTYLDTYAEAVTDAGASSIGVGSIQGPEHSRVLVECREDRDDGGAASAELDAGLESDAG